MKKFFVLMCLSLAFISCSKYNTNIAPPPDGATIEMVFPEKISKVVGEPSQNPSFNVGVEYVYENLGTIWVYNASTENDALYFANKKIIPMVKNMPIKSTNITNKKYHISAKKGDNRLFAWNNGKWIFMIKAKDKRSFKKIVKAFPWIEDK